MSWQAAEEPEARTPPSCKALEAVIVPRPRDLGGFEVRRVLPSAERQSVGPFVFFDQIGPAELAPGAGIDVRPHPHIGLATVTYLFAGTIVHRDSLGSVQSIEPGEVNWMTAGRGIVHSERSDNELRKRRQKLYGIQIWVALPKQHEETDPGFTHYAAESLPQIERDGKTVRVVAGSLFGEKSPVKTFSKLFYGDARVSRELCSRSITSTRNARFTCSKEMSRSQGKSSSRNGFWFSRPAMRSPSRQHQPRGCCCSAASRSTVRVISGGTLSQARASVSSKQRRTGKPGVSRRCPAIPSLFRCLNDRDASRRGS